MKRKILFLGAGGKTRKELSIQPSEHYPAADEEEVVTLDMFPPADVIFDLDSLHMGVHLPFPDNYFDEIHAYEVLEHIGNQGDWKGFFREWSEYHRILKQVGFFFLTVPNGIDEVAWGDPGHTRRINGVTLAFLNQHEYERQLKEGIPMTDYRSVWKGHFSLVFKKPSDPPNRVGFILQKQPVDAIVMPPQNAP